MKILTVVGARPQFVKSAVVSRQIGKTEGIEERIIHTGQHFDANMSEIFFEQMDIPRPDFQLEVSGLSHGAMTGRMLEQIEAILLEQKPNMVMVYGDTNSTLAGALAASKLHIPVAHVEAGLRSFNMKMPEEINRILTDRVSRLLLCPTETAVANLDREGFGSFGARVVNCGDVMQDAALYYTAKEQPPVIGADLSGGFVLSTIHRAENTDSPESLTQIFDALNQIHSELPVVLPIHPRTRAKLDQFNIDSRVHLIDPVGYLEMIYLLRRCNIVMTDSGG
ncbi:MAG: UDP-N-acetylglucosamine 2-epimerase (non-hydrolyzing), partial [Motiliproteus sp.]